LIIETGIAHGGSLIFSASVLSLSEICGEIKSGNLLGVVIEIRQLIELKLKNIDYVRK